MGFDWFIFFAQAVNFLILVVLLKRVLFDRIVAAMDERERGIQERIAAAEDAHIEADKRRAQYQAKIREVNEQEESLLLKAKQKASELQRERLKQAEAETQEKRRLWHEALQHEKHAFTAKLRKLALEHVHVMARRVLGELADSSLEELMARALKARLSTLSDDQIRRLRADEDNPADVGVVIRSGFPLNGKLREELAHVLKERAVIEVGPTFEQSDTIDAGFEIEGGGYRFAWSLSEYLEQLEQEVSRAIDSQAQGINVKREQEVAEQVI